MAVQKEEECKRKEFTDIVGGHGRWQLGIFTFFFFCAAPHCMHNLIMTFFAPNIDHWCARPPEVLAANTSTEQWKNSSLPLERRSGEMLPSKCYVLTKGNYSTFANLERTADGSAASCQSWEYDDSFYHSTMVDEFDLECHREWMISMAKTVYMVGFLVSVVVCGQVSDRFGRRPVVITCLCVFLIAAFITLLSTNFVMFIVLRFFVALGLTSVFTVSYVALTEVISAEYRSVYCFLFKLGWVFAYMLLPGIAWLIPSWFWLQFTITAPWLALLCVWWVIPETPRWLMIHGKFTELEKVLMKAAEKNGKDLKLAKAAITDFIRQTASETEKKNGGKETVLDLLRTPRLRIITISMYFCWFIVSYIYYALSWNTNDLGGDPYWTFFICGAVELPSTILFMYVSKKIGHRLALIASNVAAGLCLLLMIPIPAEMTWLAITVSMTGKFFNSGSFDIIYIYSAEVFPTVVRNVGVGSSSTWARVGALTAPFIKQWADVTHPSVPLAVPGALSIISGLILLWLPETKGKKLPDTLEEGEQFGRKRKKNLLEEGANGFQLANKPI